MSTAPLTPSDDNACHMYVTAHEPRYYEGNARDLSFLPAASIDLIVTSPPYWLRRDYGHPEQLGQEASQEAYIAALVAIMEAWGRLLRPHASVFINLGDTYRNGFLVGIPALFEVAARAAGWHVVNSIVWVKAVGRPEPLPYRLASRHETIFHLTRARDVGKVFVDPYALANHRGRTANAGDVWPGTGGEETPPDGGADPLSNDEDDSPPNDVWELHATRSKSQHPAPFPPDLARRAILFACPERLCSACGSPHTRRLAPTAELDPERPQARRAMALFGERGLSAEHLAAIRAVGISDAGAGKRMQRGSGRNAARVQRLAAEAKEALGGYFREFTFGRKRMVGWTTCGCDRPTTAGTVLDPFMGSGTTLAVAQSLGRHSIGVDLVVPDTHQKVT